LDMDVDWEGLRSEKEARTCKPNRPQKEVLDEAGEDAADEAVDVSEEESEFEQVDEEVWAEEGEEDLSEAADEDEEEERAEETPADALAPEDEARRIAKEFAAAERAQEDEGSNVLNKGPTDSNNVACVPVDAGVAMQDEPLQELPGGGASGEPGGDVDSDDEEKKAEMIKRKTLAVADEIAEGIDRVRLAEAEETISSMKEVSPAQIDACKNSMSRRLTIVQGPPGTGKTHTSVRIITMWAKFMGYKPILATSECNIAVDNIAEGLVRQGVKVCRIGRPEKVREMLETSVLDNMVKIEREDRHKRERDEGQDSEAEELGEQPEDENTEDYAVWQRRRDIRRKKMAWDRKQDSWMRARFLEEAQVLCATTITAGSQALSDFKFHGILIDEVAQATETSTLVPIVCRGAKQLVLCGDHCQLPPSVQSREAELRGFSLSLYSRLVEAGVPFRFLDTQYRAHPMLMEFSASCIYQGKLKDGIDGSGRPQPKGIDWPNPDCPAAFFPCTAEEHLDGESKANKVEAQQLCDIVKKALAYGELGMGDIGVVTPYKGQVRTLRRILFDQIEGAEKSRELEIASVDNFQGREKELIIFSAVRCNHFGGVGFLADWRRLNVMITRARRGLIVIGDAMTLCQDPHWKIWLEFTEKQGGAAKGTVEVAMEEAAGKGIGKGKGKNKRKPTNAGNEGKGGAAALGSSKGDASMIPKNERHELLLGDGPPGAGDQHTVAKKQKKEKMEKKADKKEKKKHSPEDEAWASAWWGDEEAAAVPSGVATSAEPKKKKKKVVDDTAAATWDNGDWNWAEWESSDPVPKRKKKKLVA